ARPGRCCSVRAMDETLPERRIGHTTVLFGARGGKYPHGNSLVVRGRDATAVIDPSLGLVARGGDIPHPDLVLNSHCHEDHVAGNHLFPDVPWHVHEADRPGFASLDGLMAIYGYPAPILDAFRRVVVDDFHYRARPDAKGFTDGALFDLG